MGVCIAKKRKHFLIMIILFQLNLENIIINIVICFLFISLTISVERDYIIGWFRYLVFMHCWNTAKI